MYRVSFCFFSCSRILLITQDYTIYKQRNRNEFNNFVVVVVVVVVFCD